VLESALTSNDQRAGDYHARAHHAARRPRDSALSATSSPHRSPGTTSELYFKALSRLGSLGGPEAIETLKSALYRGTWWAPRRTARLRNAAAQALAKIEGPEAREVLREAAESGPRGVRAAARKATA
jgi:HEAT repeat protein